MFNDIIGYLIIIRTVIVPLIVKLARVLELFGLNNQTSKFNTIYFFKWLAILWITECQMHIVITYRTCQKQACN